MKQIVILSLLVCLLISCHDNDGFRIDADKPDRLCILVDENPGISAGFAAKELQYHIQESMGVELPVCKGELPARTLPICVGESEFTRNMGINTNDFEDQEYLIRIEPGYVILAGKDIYTGTDSVRPGNGIHRTPQETSRLFDYGKANGDPVSEEQIIIPGPFDPQGSCYAVYDFLERFFGVRWYGPHPDNRVVPEHASLLLSPLEIRRSPALKYRGGFFYAVTMTRDLYFHATDEMCRLHASRMRVGGEPWACNHSFTSYMDRFLTRDKKESELHEEYRPEYFAQGQGEGERQLCYTNRALIEQVARDACDYFDGKPLKGGQVALGDYFALVPHDNANWCKCEDCQALLEKDSQYKRGEHFSSGTASHYLFNFVNEVAKIVKQSHPDKTIAALSYWVYAYLPKDIELESNISVAPCLHTRNYWAPKIKDNDMFIYRQWIEDSKKRGSPVFLWNYYCFPTERGDNEGFNVFPGFCAHTLDEQIKMFAKDGVRGVFLCGIGEQVDYYITMKLYDDPGQDIDTLLNEFFSLYFGNAAAPMQRFYTTIEKRYSDPNNYPEEIRVKDAQFHQVEEHAWKYLGTREVMDELGTYIAEAREKARTEMEKRRVESWAVGIWDYMVKGREQYLAKQ